MTRLYRVTQFKLRRRLVGAGDTVRVQAPMGRSLGYRGKVIAAWVDADETIHCIDVQSLRDGLRRSIEPGKVVTINSPREPHPN